MEPSELLHLASQTWDRLEIPYLVTGSIATIAYGEPRFTNDIDVVIRLNTDQIDTFCEVSTARILLSQRSSH